MGHISNIVFLALLYGHDILIPPPTCLEVKKGAGKLGSTMKVISSPKSRRVSLAPWIFVHFPHGCLCSWRPFTPIEVFKPVLEPCSGLQCFPFKGLPGIGENWWSATRAMVSSLLLSSYHPRKKCFFRLSNPLPSQQRLVEETHWSLTHLLLRGNVCTRSGLSAESHFHHRSCVSCAYSHSTH